MSSIVGITRFGAYIPRLRLDRKAIYTAHSWFAPGLKGLARGARSMANWDEDSVTMAVAAARDCLNGDATDRLGAVWLASTTLPFADRDCATLMAGALNLPDTVSTMSISSSRRAGTASLASAFAAARAEPAEILLTASEHPRARVAGPQEQIIGDGAAAFTIGTDDVVCEFLGAAHIAEDFIDQYRGEGETADFTYAWEDRWIRDEGYLKIVPRTVAAAIEKAGCSAAEIDRLILPVAQRGVAEKVAKILGVADAAVAPSLQEVVGLAGTAHPLIMLAGALEALGPGKTIALVGWGGGCDALILKTTDRIGDVRPRLGLAGHLARGRAEQNYFKYLAFNRLVNMELGLRSEVDKQTALSALHRNSATITGLVGGKCESCGTIQFPKGQVCVNPNCHARGPFSDVPMADTPAHIHSWTADHLTYTIDPPQHFGMVTFEGGGRFVVDITDAEAGEITTGMPVRMEFRIKDYDDRRGFTRYFWKAVPAGNAEVAENPIGTGAG